MGISDLRFIGTGKSMNPFTNPKLNRDPSRKGIEFSGIKSTNELGEKLRANMLPKISDLGDGAVKVMRSMQQGSRINLMA